MTSFKLLLIMSLTLSVTALSAAALPAAAGGFSIDDAAKPARPVAKAVDAGTIHYGIELEGQPAEYSDYEPHTGAGPSKRPSFKQVAEAVLAASNATPAPAEGDSAGDTAASLAEAGENSTEAPVDGADEASNETSADLGLAASNEDALIGSDADSEAVDPEEPSGEPSEEPSGESSPAPGEADSLPSGSQQQAVLARGDSDSDSGRPAPPCGRGAASAAVLDEAFEELDWLLSGFPFGPRGSRFPPRLSLGLPPAARGPCAPREAAAAASASRLLGAPPPRPPPRCLRRATARVADLGPGGWRLTAEMPGARAAGSEVSVSAEGVLTARAQADAAPLGPRAAFAPWWGPPCAGGTTYEAAFRLPFGTDLDSLEAFLDDGVLAVTVPKPASEGPVSVPVVSARGAQARVAGMA